MGYFYNFCKMHGDPVDDGKRLIFPDGWTYARTDYAGPEVPPPKDEQVLRALMLVYWTEKVKQARARRDEFVEQVRVLHETKNQRSAPIAIEAWVPNSQGYLYPTAKEVDWTILEKDLEFAQRRVEDAEARLREVRKEAEVLGAR